MTTVKTASLLDAIAEHNRLMTSYLYSFQTDSDAAKATADRLNRHVEHMMRELGMDYAEILRMEERILHTA